LVIRPNSNFNESQPAESTSSSDDGRSIPSEQEGTGKAATAESKKRRLESEAGPESSDDTERLAPRSKRIHIQRLQAVSEEPLPVANRSETNDPNTKETEVPKKHPLSGHSDDTGPAKTASQAEVVNDADEGPVKMAGRVSAKRVHLFSDEEDSAADAPKPVKPSSSSGTTEEILAVDGEKAAIDPQKPLPTKAAVKEAGFPSEAHVGLEDNKEEKVLVTSQNSAFERKESAVSKLINNSQESSRMNAETTPSTSMQLIDPESEAKLQRPSTPQDTSLAPSTVRSGRRAAKEANERIVSTKQDSDKEKERDKERPPPAAKKRKKRNDEDSEDSNEDDNNWVQCDQCKKWRIIPNHIKISSLPERWYCHLNVYDPKRNSCDAPEQTARTPVVDKKRKRGGKKKRLRVAEAIDSANTEEAIGLGRHDSSQSETTKEKVRARSPTPKEETKAKDAPQICGSSTPKPPRSSPNSISVGSAENASIPEAEPEVPPPTRKASKPEKKTTKRLPDAPLETIPEVAPDEVPVKVKRGRSGRSRKEIKESNTKDGSSKEREPEQGNSSGRGGASTQPADQDRENVEWVQCEKCDKWRKLPPHISADELPDVWYCSLNTWNVSSASCDAPEDKADGQQDIGPCTDRGGSGKLSYRNLIFGSGRKVNRPVSERTRAAESIFAIPSEDSECAYPTVSYANSSAFAPRGSRANIIEEDNDTFSVFTLLHHSTLWANLRGSSQPYKANPTESAGFGKPFLPKYSFETLPLNIKHDMKEMILSSLDNKSLLSEEILLECQCRQWNNAPPSWSQARAYCTKDAVITLLCELVKEGKLQLVQAFGKDWTTQDWNPRYCRVSTNENATPPEPKSRCLRISKPWKKAL